eukprot:GFKZ01013234.1.p1 GENE.GFKZ01013234.1~~GFKZ01013234.1.p1  ORF type:complete len:809 (+),score=81.49 GFKZ01013234.1:195-2621(+)
MTILNPESQHVRDISKHVLVIGGGVIGITTAIRLRESGFNVSVVAEKYENITSNVAGALWEWPPAVCGRHGDPRSLESSKHWCMVSYEKFKELHSLHGQDESGIYLQDVYFYFRYLVEDCTFNLNKMNELKDKVDGFERGLHIIPEEVDATFVKDHIRDCYKHMAPMVDTDKYMPWIRKKARDMGCVLLQERIDSNVILDEKLLLQRYDADAIVACPGLGAIGILGDSQMYPLRGALVRVKQPDRVITAAHCISHEDGSNSEQDIVFIVPRGENTIVLGGLAQPNRWDYGLTLHEPIISQMYQGCLGLLPALRQMDLDPAEHVRTGLRPFTERNVLLDRVPGTNVVVNYGHGGAGVTLSWGCAEHAVKLVKSITCNNPAFMSDVANKLDSSRPTTFILQDMLSFRTQMGRIKFMDHNLVLICSRRGLSKIPGHEFIHFNLVRVIDEYELDPILSSVSEVVASSGLSVDQCRIVTNDEYSILLCGQLRESLGITGPGADRMLPFFDKDATKKAIIRGGLVRLPQYVVFDGNAFQADPNGYVDKVLSTVGSKIFIKPVVGAGSEKTWRLDGREALMQWCEDSGTCEGVFEIDERITGELFNTSVIRVNGKEEYFFALRHNRPNDEYLRGGKLGNIIVAESDSLYPKLKQFSARVLDELHEYCEDNCVYNIDLFVESGSDDMVLMEVAARAAGGGVGKVIEECCGIALDETSLLLQMGHGSVLKMRESEKMTCYAAYSLHPPKAGVVKRLQKPQVNSTVSAVSWRTMPGQRLSEPKSMRDIAVMVVISNPDLEELTEDFRRITSEEYVIME